MGVKILSDKIVTDLDLIIRVNLANFVLIEILQFKSLRIPTSDAMDIPNLDFAPSTRAKSLNGTRRDNFRDSRLGYTHDFERMRKARAYSNHIKSSELGTGQVFEQETENIPQTQQTDLMITLNDNPLTRSTDSSKNEKRHEPEVNPDPEPSSSESSSDTCQSDSIENKKKLNKKKKRRKHQKYDSSDPSSIDDSDSSDDSNYRRKRRKKKNHQKKYPIKLCAHLMATLPTTAYKSNIIRFRMDEDPLQRRIYFLTLVESIEMIFSHYKETCEVILDYPKIGGDDIIEDYAKKAFRNILHTNIDVHIRRLIAEFPKDVIKCIEIFLITLCKHEFC